MSAVYPRSQPLEQVLTRSVDLSAGWSLQIFWELDWDQWQWQDLTSNVVTQLRQESSMHTTIKEMLSTQHKQKFTWLTHFLPEIVCGWI